MNAPLFGYLSGSTPLHRVDPLSKLAVVLLCSVVVFVTTDLRVIGVQLAVLLVAALVGRPREAPLLRPLLLIVLLCALLVFFQVTNVHTGTVVWEVGPVEVRSGGLERGVLYATRVATLMLASFVFVRTTDPRRLVVALIALRIPYRYAWTVFIALTSIALLQAEFTTAREAQLVRGLPAARTRAHRELELWRRYARSLLVVGLRRVEVVSVAMDLRGFGAAPTRTFIDPFVLSRAGVALVGVWTVALALVIVVALRS